MVEYFVKNLKIHMYPVPIRCTVRYTKEKRYKFSPKGYEKCDKCFRLYK